eukprot:2180588-Pyramimonas_sp.AAC.1
MFACKYPCVRISCTSQSVSEVGPLDPVAPMSGASVYRRTLGPDRVRALRFLAPPWVISTKTPAVCM